MSGEYDRHGRDRHDDAQRGPAVQGASAAPGKRTLTAGVRRSPPNPRRAVATANAELATLSAKLRELARAVDPGGDRDIDRARSLSLDVECRFARVRDAIDTAHDDATPPELAAELAACEAEHARLETEAAPLLALKPPSHVNFDDVMLAATHQDEGAFARLDAASARERADWNAMLDGHGKARAANGATPADPKSGIAATAASDLGAERAALEAAFGMSLNGVQLHGDRAAAGLAEQLSAQAFAVGNEVALPDSLGGERTLVLAHEIAHVVQQRGGTGGAADLDPEEAAEAAALAFVAGQPIPPQPAASIGVARRGTYVRTQPQVPVEGRDPRGYGDKLPINTTPTIGNQNGDTGTGTNWSGAAAEAALRGDLDAAKRELEQPKPTIEFGGTAPNFVSAGSPKQITFSGPSASVQRNLVVDYTPHRFHVRSSIISDLISARTLDEVASIWSAYLKDKPQAPPWPLRAKPQRETSPWEIDECSVDGPGHWEPGKLTLPAGSPLDPDAMVLIRVGDSFVSWPSRLTPFPEDPSGAARIGTLTVMIETLADADVIPGLMELVRPHKKRKAKIDTQDAPTADPASSTTGTRPADPAADNGRRRRPIPTLRLPQSKAPHLGLYQNLAASRVLVHEADYERDQDEQAAKWDAALKPGGSHGISQPLWIEGKKLIEQLARTHKRGKYRGIYRPDWSRFQLHALMEVDHIIELQVVTRSDLGWADAIDNYELLERGANRSSGSRLKKAIDDERKDLFAQTGDRAYLDQPLTFERVVLGDGGITGERWTVGEIRSGEHLDALRANAAMDAFPEGLAEGTLDLW